MPTFEGMILNVCGVDEALNGLLEELEYISGIEVLSRYDLENGMEDWSYRRCSMQKKLFLN
jgi:hypothetical protein